MRKSITSNHSDISSEVTFAEAAKATTRAWRRKHGYGVPVPALSHSLSMLEGNTWTVLDAELGEPVAVVVDGMSVLVEDLPVDLEVANG